MRHPLFDSGGGARRLLVMSHLHSHRRMGGADQLVVGRQTGFYYTGAHHLRIRYHRRASRQRSASRRGRIAAVDEVIDHIRHATGMDQPLDQRVDPIGQPAQVDFRAQGLEGAAVDLLWVTDVFKHGACP